jgi:hypothetical protein
MNLSQTIRAIEKAAAMQPNVRTIVRNDVFRLNAQPDVRYGVVAWLQGEHATSADSQLVKYQFTLFYVDRLTEDKGNEVQIQSVGIETLENILRTLQDVGLFPAADYYFRTFNQRFNDECAGAFCTVRLETTKNDLCAAYYDLVGDVSAFALEKDGAGWKWVNNGQTTQII